jgi:hypothetical protein
MRNHDVRGQTAGELERARRELAASLALARPDSPIRAPILSHMTAIDAELAERSAQTASVMVRLCSCGFATDDDAWFDDHLFERPAHSERTLDRYLDRTPFRW